MGRRERRAPAPSARADVNDYLREASGGPFTAKDFRTWFATLGALRAAEEAAPGEYQRSDEAGARHGEGRVREARQYACDLPKVLHPSSKFFPRMKRGSCALLEWRQCSAGASQAARAGPQIAKKSEESYVPRSRALCRRRQRALTAGAVHSCVRIGGEVRTSHLRGWLHVSS